MIDAFRDVQSAKIDLQRLVNEAADLRQQPGAGAPMATPRASVQEAQAYSAQIVLQAQGDAARFISVYSSYKARRM